MYVTFDLTNSLDVPVLKVDQLIEQTIALARTAPPMCEELGSIAELNLFLEKLRDVKSVLHIGIPH
jgi:hypothetical protein